MILAICRPREGTDPAAFSRLLPDETHALATMSQDGTLVQAWTMDEPGAILLLNSDTSAASKILNNLPLAQAGMLTFEVIAVRPINVQPE